jgi:hypothetical protein
MEEFIERKKPDLSLNSVKTYASNLRKICKHLKYDGHISHLLKEKHCQVLNYIGTMPDNRIKQAASAALIIDPDNVELKEMIMDANKRCNESDEKQELTPAQKLAWLSWSDIIAVREKLKEECNPLWIKLNLSWADYFLLQNYVISMVLTIIPPRRCMDFCFMSLEDEPNEEDNYITIIDGVPYFVFRKYKTSKTYGEQSIKIPDKLWEVLREWKKISVSKWLFHVSQSKPVALRPDQFTRRIAQVFNQKGFGVNLLRHAYVSDELLSGMPFISELQENAYKLGHSIKESVLYKKHTN